MLPIIHGYDLEGFIHGDPCPPRFLQVGEGSTGTNLFASSTESNASNAQPMNPKYLSWKMQDQFLLSWLSSTVSRELLGYIAKF